MSTPERCLRCDWWNFSRSKCDRIFKATIRVAQDGGEIRLETMPGLLPRDMENDFSIWLVNALGDYIDAWPGWTEIKRIRDGGKPCAAEKPSAAIKEFGSRLSLVKPLAGGPLSQQEPQPLKNLDCHGLFKADTSLL